MRKLSHDCEIKIQTRFVSPSKSKHLFEQMYLVKLQNGFILLALVRRAVSHALPRPGGSAIRRIVRYLIGSLTNENHRLGRNLYDFALPVRFSIFERLHSQRREWKFAKIYRLVGEDILNGQSEAGENVTTIERIVHAMRCAINRTVFCQSHHIDALFVPVDCPDQPRPGA